MDAKTRADSTPPSICVLLIAGGVLAIVVTAARADEQLPAVTVTGQATPPPKPPDGGSQVLQKNSRFRWLSSDLPQDIGIFAAIPPDWVDAQVVECDPPTRLGWSSHGRQWTIHGPLVASYHNWYIKPMGPKRCLVTFEEVATGVAARYTRGSCPELVHLTHEHWLEDLKRISETRS